MSSKNESASILNGSDVFRRTPEIGPANAIMKAMAMMTAKIMIITLSAMPMAGDDAIERKHHVQNQNLLDDRSE